MTEKCSSLPLPYKTTGHIWGMDLFSAKYQWSSCFLKHSQYDIVVPICVLRSYMVSCGVLQRPAIFRQTEIFGCL
jgi:hypothetical protein